MSRAEQLQGPSVAETVAALDVRPNGDGTLVAHMPSNVWGPVVFGGFVIAQAIAAVTVDAPDGRRLHSLHAYFLRRVEGGKRVDYRVAPLREGRTLASRRLDAEQDGEHVLSMTCSFAADVSGGYEYQAAMPADAGAPDEAEVTDRFDPWLIVRRGPTPPRADGTMRSTHRMWFRTVDPLPDDARVAEAFTGFASDITWTGARPLHLEDDTRGIVSVDHAIWFHRPMRPDAWCYYDVRSVVNAGGRGFLRAAMYSEDGLLCASVAQETMLRRYEDA